VVVEMRKDGIGTPGEAWAGIGVFVVTAGTLLWTLVDRMTS
jgi:hypothetical protein